MYRQGEPHARIYRRVTRRDVLKRGMTASLGLTATRLLGATRRRASAQGLSGGHATVANYAYPEVWDPHIAGTLGANAAISPLYNQLVEFNPLNPTEVVGDLAQRWEVQDAGLTYVFHLHEHVQWWDGHALTAEDVAFSLNRMIEPGKPRPRVGLLRPYIEAADVIDRATVRVRLHYPSPAFLQFLAVDYMKVVPKHVVEAGVDINVWENIVGSGPFRIKTARRGDAVTYERNPTYFKPGRPHLDGLTLVAIIDKGTVAAAIKTGKIQMTTAASNLDVEDALQLAKDLPGKMTVFFIPVVTTVQHFFVNVERQPWKDLRVIKALKLATDQQEIQKAFGAGRFLVGAPFPVGSWYGRTPDELRQRPGYRVPKTPDIVAAKALLKAAGYDPPSTLGKRVVLTPTAIWFSDLAQLWAAQLRRHLGLDIDIKLVDSPTDVNAFVSGDFDIGLWGYGYNIDDPDDYVNAIYAPGARNYTQWRHPTFLTSLAAQSREVDRDKCQQLLRQMEELLLTEEDPYIEVEWWAQFFTVSHRVRTEAGPFIVPRSIQTVLKQEHWWLERA